MRKVYFALILSVFLHLLLVEGLVSFPVPKPLSKDVVEIEIQPLNDRKSQKETKQVVREALVPEQIKKDDSEDPLRFWSAQTQRVKKQTRAPDFGLTKNRANRPNERQLKHANNGSGKPERQLPKLDKEALINSARQAGGLMRFPQADAPGVSTIGEALPEDVRIGSFTALNTDRYLFYSFFARVEELIRYRWETSVEHAIDTVPRERFQASVNNKWTTQLEVLLNPKGNFLKVLMMKESGVPAFDQAAAMSFAQARYFPNPPKEMVEEDGMIHLKYSFTVYFDPHTVARP